MTAEKVLDNIFKAKVLLNEIVDGVSKPTRVSQFPDVKIPRKSCGGCHFNNVIDHYWECCIFDVVTNQVRCDECRKALPNGGTLQLMPKEVSCK
jgi:ribosomal protein S27E